MLLRPLAQQPEPVSLARLAKLTELSRTKTASVVARLEDQGAVTRDATGQVTLSAAAAEEEADIHAAVDAQEKLREAHRARVEPMHLYACTRACRRAALLAHFGDTSLVRCSGCDNCDLSAPA